MTREAIANVIRSQMVMHEGVHDETIVHREELVGCIAAAIDLELKQEAEAARKQATTDMIAGTEIIAAASLARHHALQTAYEDAHEIPPADDETRFVSN